jgi:hypothetical protein
MAMTQWYELRLAAPRGESGGQQSVALAGNGRLCSVASGNARKFDSAQEAIDFLAQTTITQLYEFEAVLCQAIPTSRPKRSPAPENKRANG